MCCPVTLIPLLWCPGGSNPDDRSFKPVQEPSLPEHRRLPGLDSNPYFKNENLESWPLDEQIIDKSKKPGLSETGLYQGLRPLSGRPCFLPRSWIWIYVAQAGNESVFKCRMFPVERVWYFGLVLAQKRMSFIVNKKPRNLLRGVCFIETIGKSIP
jgi:hypothetical protein